jgi:hypothetical protein
MPDILSAIAPTIVGTGMGLLMQKQQDQRQLEQQNKLSEQQAKWDTAASNRNTVQQMDLWNKTGYAAQVGQLKEAGLNPALMYAKGGAGGSTQAATTNRNAPDAPKSSGMEITQSIQGMQQAMQLQLLQAQKENIEADTKNKLVDAEKKSGVDTDNVKTNTLNTKQDTENKILDGVLKKYTGLEAKDQYEKIKVPNRGIEEKTYKDELEARQGIAENIYELWQSGQLLNKSNAEIESLLISNSKSREQIKQITKTLDMLEEQIKGQKLSNMLQDVETQWATGTGLKSGNATTIIMKLIERLLGKHLSLIHI